MANPCSGNRCLTAWVVSDTIKEFVMLCQICFGAHQLHYETVDQNLIRRLQWMAVVNATIIFGHILTYHEPFAVHWRINLTLNGIARVLSSIMILFLVFLCGSALKKMSRNKISHKREPLYKYFIVALVITLGTQFASYVGLMVTNSLKYGYEH
mmetsp:Transcript_30086/g.41926  ORF Transcript_30086/g.41926 Transcript_30086/m.41926 type:complete len:154 (-) Transcript_30086:1308-1769(-)